MRNTNKYLVLLCLYIAQSVPMSFFSTVLPVIMRQENISLSTIAYIQMIKMPWIIKFIWAPMVDDRATSIRHYIKWIIWTELLYALALVILSFISFSEHLTIALVFIIIAIVFSATQDIASDAFAIKILDRKERGLGNSMQSSGSFLGTLFGSGVLLMLYPVIGWQFIVILLAVVVLCALVPVYLFTRDESKFEHIVPTRTGIRDIASFFKQKATPKRIVLLMFYYSGLIGILAMLKPMLVDYGYSMKTIGFIFGIYGTSLAALSAFVAGFLLKKFSRKTVLILFALLNLLVAPVFILLTQDGFSLAEVYTGVGLIWICYGLSTVGIYTISMDFVRKGKEGTDFTMQIVITHLSGILMAIIAGNLAERFGYQRLFLAEIGFGLMAVVSVLRLYQSRKKSAVGTA